jgi:prepilin-type N-terminal cleavage/methylation domain-containing protein/prepilin-type processing-associated H-X9-DG protein
MKQGTSLVKERSHAFDRNGFTLIELLTVIAVIAILAGILTTGLGAARKSVMINQSISNMRSIGAAILLYSSDNQNRLPDNLQQNKPTWDIELLPYIGLSSETIKALNYSRGQPVSGVGSEELFAIFASPADTVERTANGYKRSYALRAWVNNVTYRGPETPPDMAGQVPNRGVQLAAVENPSKASLLVESFQKTNLVGSGLYTAQHVPTADPSYAGGWMHDGKTPILFLDGHVEVIDKETALSNRATTPYWPHAE